MTLYASVADLRAHAKQLVGIDEALLGLVLEVASRDVDHRCIRSYGAFAATAPSVVPEARTFNVARGGRLVFTDFFIGDAEVTVDGRTVAHTDRPSPHGWPTSSLALAAPAPGPVDVSARWGWSATPEPARLATLFIAHQLWVRRDSPGGIFGTPETGVVRENRWDPLVDRLLAPFVRASALVA